MSTTVTVRGRVTIPKDMRDFLRLRPGDRVDFEFADDGSISLRPARRAAKKKAVKDHFGPLVGVRGRNGSTDALMELLRGYSKDHDDPGFR